MPVLGPGIADYTPSTDQVHALIPQRKVFTGTSVPTVAEVEGLVDQAVQSLRAEFGDTLNARYVGKARFVVALNAASLVESAYFPEQQGNDTAPAAMLYQRYQAELLGLRALLGEDAAGSSSFVSVGVASATLTAARRIAAGQLDPNPDVNGDPYWGGV